MTQIAPQTTWLQRHRRLLLIGGPVLLAAIAALLYLTGGRYVSTDDAYVQAARVDVSASISARVVAVDVRDNQFVHQGDVLFRLDDRDLRIAVEDAQAKLASAKLQVAALKATYLQRQADARAADDALAYARRELGRQTVLARRGISSQAQLDQARNALSTAEQQRNAMGQARANVLATLGGDAHVAVEEHPTVKQAQAALDRAELNLSYAMVRAPMDGIVSKVEQLQVGDYIKQATPLFALTSNRDIWIEANFKETDVTHMRAGQEATIAIDTYPGHTFHGRVDSFSAGTGSSFSLLPPENASGNWVKVVQRLPVRIHIDDPDPKRPLHAGLSADVEVDTHYRRLGRESQ